MRLFLVVTLCAFVAIIEGAKPNPSFMRYVGSYKYNETESGHFTVKNYYVSQRIDYNWIDSYLYCKSVGMHMATVNTPGEMKNLAVIANKEPIYFNTNVYIDGRKSSATETPDKCLSILKRSSRFEIRRVDCLSKQQKFLCEDVELADTFVEEKAPEKSMSLRIDEEEVQYNVGKVETRSTWFHYLGRSSYGSSDPKSYYISDFPVSTFDAMKICQSFDMILASPNDQDEYDRIRSLISNHNSPWIDAYIAGYRSEEDHDVWLDSKDQLNYRIAWMGGEPNDGEGKENCIVFKNSNYGNPTMNDVDCSSMKKFICEYAFTSDSEKVVKKVDENELARFMTPLTTYKVSSTDKQLYLGKYELDWMNAILMCRSFGMELLTPISADENKNLLEFLGKQENVPANLHIGYTSKGLGRKWYAPQSGNMLSFKVGWNPDRGEKEHDCMLLLRSGQNWYYQDSACFDTMNHFICQKFDEPEIMMDFSSEEDW